MAERTRTAGWLPNQHGAWAMLVVPFAAGTILCWRSDRLQPYLAGMLVTWMVGYFAFHAASGLLKSASARRHRWLPAFVTYATATLLAGLLTIWLAGPPVAWWLAVFALPLGVALWLASQRQERRLAGGLLTTGVASAMVLVTRFPDPTAMVGDPGFPSAALLAGLVFGYFGGTVLHVKAMIRNRGQLAARNASIGWHTLWTLATAGLSVAGILGRAWPVFFLATTLRAWLLPTVADRRPVRPPLIGMIEIVGSATLLVVAAVA